MIKYFQYIFISVKLGLTVKNTNINFKITIIFYGGIFRERLGYL